MSEGICFGDSAYVLQLDMFLKDKNLLSKRRADLNVMWTSLLSHLGDQLSAFEA